MQEIIVTVIVVYAFWVVAKRYTPQALQRFARTHMARAVRRLGWTAIASRLATAKPAASACSQACASCRGCGHAQGADAVRRERISFESIKGSPGRVQKSVE